LTQFNPPTINIASMPTYQYVCEKCGHQFDQLQPISAKPLTICPEELCARKRWGKGKVRRAITAGAGLIFKGSGFYITDYRSDKYKEAAKKDSAPASASASGKTASGGESKPAQTKAADKPTKAATSKN
jgi:putative FmdB family regulatory protein